MEFNEYLKQAITTKLYPEGMAVPYVTLGLMGEAGEVAEKIKKVIRDDNGIISEAKKQDLGKEIGDVLWYVAALCDELGLDFNQVALDNIAKLQSRKERGVLQGSGDNR